MAKSRQEKEWEWRELYKKKGLKKALMPTGYEAFRISPRTTLKFGKPFKKIYGATVSPDYSRPTSERNKFGNPTRFGANVQWYPHGFVPASVKSGTRMLQPLRYYPVVQEEARYKLMLKKRKVNMITMPEGAGFPFKVIGTS